MRDRDNPAVLRAAGIERRADHPDNWKHAEFPWRIREVGGGVTYKLTFPKYVLVAHLASCTKG